MLVSGSDGLIVVLSIVSKKSLSAATVIVSLVWKKMTNTFLVLASFKRGIHTSSEIAFSELI